MNIFVRTAPHANLIVVVAPIISQRYPYRSGGGICCCDGRPTSMFHSSRPYYV